MTRVPTTSPRGALNKLISSSKTTKTGGDVGQRPTEAIKFSSSSTHPSDNNNKVLERLTAIEKRIQFARQPHPLCSHTTKERYHMDNNTFKGKETQEI